MTHSNCILESACKRIKRQRKKKEYEMYKTESQNSERAGWVPERPEPSIATKKQKFQYAEKRESKYTYRRKPNFQMYSKKTTEGEQHSPQKFQNQKKKKQHRRRGTSGFPSKEPDIFSFQQQLLLVNAWQTLLRLIFYFPPKAGSKVLSCRNYSSQKRDPKS